MINIGSGSTRTGRWLDQVYISTDTTLNVMTDTRVAALRTTATWPPSRPTRRTESIPLPDDISGLYYVFIYTDAGNDVFEGSETNNIAYDRTPVDVQLQLPNLQVSGVDAPTTAIAGQPIALSWTVSNNGAGRTRVATWYDQVYLSSDATLNPATDTLVATYRRDGVLAKNAQYNVSNLAVPMPLGFRGNYYVFVRTDATNLVNEGTSGAENDNDGYDLGADRPERRDGGDAVHRRLRGAESVGPGRLLELPADRCEPGERGRQRLSARGQFASAFGPRLVLRHVVRIGRAGPGPVERSRPDRPGAGLLDAATGQHLE